METERLYLEMRTRERLELLLSQSVEEQLDYFGIENIEEMENRLAGIKRTLKKQGIGWRMWAIVEKKSQKVIGDCGFHNWVLEHDRSEVGYGLYEAYRNNGYMYEAMQKVVEYGFEELKLNRIEACISPDNIPSRKLIEKLGFEEEGTLRQHYKSKGKIYDSVIYSKLKSDKK